MTLRSAGLAIAVGSPLLALYILGVILLLDLDSPQGQYALAVPVAIFLGFVPWGFLLDRMTASGQPVEAGTSPKWLPVFVAVLDAAKGALAVALGWAAIGTAEGTTGVGLAVLAGDTSSRCLFRYGRTGPVTVGSLLVLQPLAGAVAVALVPPAALAARRGIPGGLLVALAVLVAPLVMVLVGQSEYILLAFAGPAAALMLLQYRKAPPSTGLAGPRSPTPPASTSPP